MKIDCLYNCDVIDCLSFLDKESIDLLVADPPYNMSKALWDNFSSESKYFDFMFCWLDEVLPKLKDTASVYLFNNAYNSATILNYLKKNLCFQNWITWYKQDGFSSTKKKYVNNQETILFFTKTKDHYFNADDIRIPYKSTERILHAQTKGILKNGKRWFPNPNGKLCSDVWEIASQRHKDKVNGKVQKSIHPTQKPFELIERIIKASSREGDIVLDLFSGLGTTSIVSRRLNRHFIACENNPTYVEYIKSHLYGTK